MKALVTGGAGFIGSAIVRELESRGAAVRVLDDLSTGRESNLDGTVADLVVGSVLDDDVRRRCTEGIDVVFHEAALSSVTGSMADPIGYHRANVDGVLGMLLAARDAGVQRFVFAGSASAYGDDPAQPKHERLLPAPMSPYAASKVAGEHLCQVFARSFGLQTTVLRYFNVYGPRQDPASEYAAVVPLFLDLMRTGRPPTVFGDGRQTRDFVHVTDAARANALAVEAGPEAAGTVINVASGRNYTILDLVAAINSALGTNLTPIHTSERPGDIRESSADVTRARDLLGFEAELSLADGLRDTVAWMDAAQAST